MKLQVDKDSADFIEFSIEAPREYANAIRRTIMSDLPTEALDNVEITENTTCIDNDMLTQRIVLIPTFQGLETNFDFKQHNTTDTTIDVFSHDLSDTLVKDIYLVSLRPNEKLCLSASTTRGVGYSNAKWSSVTDLKYCQHRKLVGQLTPTEQDKIQKVIPQFNMRQLTEFIDTNLIFMINQICNREVFSQELQNKFTISFSTIDGSNPRDRLLQALTQLTQRTFHLNLKGNNLITNDFSIPNLLMLEHPYPDFSCIKQHNLDTFFKLSSLEHLESVQKAVASNFQSFYLALV